MQDSTETPQSDPVDDGSIAECVNESNSILSTTEGDEPLSTSLDPDISDVLFGLCPEDLSFSFHTTSHEQTLSQSPLLMIHTLA